jgi:hypothetical protein
MSGSPKYTSVTLSIERRRLEAARAAARAQERRRRQAEREARLRALEEERARKRLAKQTETLNSLLADSRRAAFEHVAAVGTVVAEVERDLAAVDASSVAAQLAGIQAELSELSRRATTDGGAELADCERAADALRVRALALRTAAYSAAGRAGRPRVVADLRQRLALLRNIADPAQLMRCDEMLAKLDAAAAETQGVRFEALHGTAEHLVASLERKAADAAAREQRRLSGADATRAARESAIAAERLDHLAARLAVLGESVRLAMSDAASFGEQALHDRLAGALASAQAASTAGRADELEALVGQLAALLPEAEAQLDEAIIGYERRGDLAAALRDVLTDKGMAFVRGSEENGRFLMRFERPGGAVYTAMIDSDGSGDTTLSYAIEGEQDVPVLVSSSGDAVCDKTEAFLDAVHDELGTTGFSAGELNWRGKPPRGQARTLPRQRTRSTQNEAVRSRQHD